MSLEIAVVTDGKLLPVCTPSLMPFHISYTGPAPVSRYFRPKPAPSPLAALSLRASSSATLVASTSTSGLSETRSSLTAVSSTTSIGDPYPESQCGDASAASVEAVEQVEQVKATHVLMDTAAGMDLDSETQPAVLCDDSSRPTGANMPASRRHVERVVAAFRGRQMYGQAVNIPSGYGGLVLRAPGSKVEDEGDAEMTSVRLSRKAEPKSKARAAAGRSKRVARNDAMDELEGGEDGEYGPESDVNSSPQARKLVPLSTFTSFMLWAPDRPVDEGKDEYARALTEWTRLAAEIHSHDE